MKPEQKFLEDLKEYFKTTPKEKILEAWEESKEFDKVGPTVDEFLSYIKERYKIKHQDPYRSYNFKFETKETRKDFGFFYC